MLLFKFIAEIRVVLLEIGDLLRTLIAEASLRHAILKSASVLSILLRQRLATRLWPRRHLRLLTAWSEVGGRCKNRRQRGLRRAWCYGHRVRVVGRVISIVTAVLGHAAVRRLAGLAEAGWSRVLLQGGGVLRLRVAKIAVVGGGQSD